MVQLFGHPFSSYTQKAEIALYENAIPFEFRMLGPDHPDNGATLMAHSPLGKFPLLIDGDRSIWEATSIIEYLAVHRPGPVALIPADPAAAIEVRMLDRLFDNYVMHPMQQIVGNQLRPEESRDPYGVDQARAMLDRAYAWLDHRLAGHEWATDAFSLADCAAAPSLFYADWAHPIPDAFPTLKAYRARLLARPSIARAVDEARPYRTYFPLGAPDRD
ncbi:glutathione S-transferase family protein [Sphingomonas sp. MMS24-J13]|uniref:glutathione S-transferase family protein n=1 Tax=Sphingomonas sp. MMS24-J13 TaxID=3238686 RepID=UPI00384CD65F